jgi:hypothetical protein
MCLKETYSEVHIGNHMPDSFLIHHGIKIGVALSTLPFNCVVVNAIRMDKKNHVGLKLSGTHQLLAYADDVNLLGHNINLLMLVRTFIGVEVIVEKSKYMLLFHHHELQTDSLKICHSSNVCG